jgi:hypothetical protein
VGPDLEKPSHGRAVGFSVELLKPLLNVGGECNRRAREASKGENWQTFDAPVSTFKIERPAPREFLVIEE